MFFIPHAWRNITRAQPYQGDRTMVPTQFMKTSPGIVYNQNPEPLVVINNVVSAQR